MLARFTLRLLRRRTTQFTGLTFTAMFSILSIFVFLLSFSLAFEDYANLSRRFVLNVFLPSNSDSSTVLLVRNTLRHLAAVDSIEYISPAKALRMFSAQYGEVSKSLLPSNPFPPTFLVYLRTGYHTVDSVMKIQKGLTTKFPFLEVAYRKDYLQALNQRYQRTLVAAIVVGLLLFFLFTFLLLFATRRFLSIPPEALSAYLYHGISRHTLFAPYYCLLLGAVLLGSFLAAGSSWLLLSRWKLLLTTLPPLHYRWLWQLFAGASLFVLLMTVLEMLRLQSKFRTR